jgi:hypothetical protein
MPLLLYAVRGLQNMSTCKRPPPHLRFLPMRHQSSVSHTVARVRPRQRAYGPRSRYHPCRHQFRMSSQTCDSNALIRPHSPPTLLVEDQIITLDKTHSFAVTNSSGSGLLEADKGDIQTVRTVVFVTLALILYRRVRVAESPVDKRSGLEQAY